MTSHFWETFWVLVTHLGVSALLFGVIISRIRDLLYNQKIFIGNRIENIQRQIELLETRLREIRSGLKQEKKTKKTTKKEG